MLRFIVLGIVPGTNIQLTFFQIMLMTAAFYGALFLLYEMKHHQPKSSQLEEFAL